MTDYIGKSRVDYIIASLSPEEVTETRNLILKPPDTIPYKMLREQLLQRPSSIAYSNCLILKILAPTSQLTRCAVCNNCLAIRQASQTVPFYASYLYSGYLYTLHIAVRMVLASTSATNNPQRNCGTRRRSSRSSALFPKFHTEIKQLRAEVQKLQTSVQYLTRQTRGCCYSHSTDASSAPPDQSTCWYHQKYGAKSRKYTPSCNYTQTSNVKDSC